MMPPSEKILVVDDEANMLALCESVLRKEGYVVVCAASAEEALALLEKDSVDLLIADLRLGNGETGLDVALMLQQNLSTVIPVLILTGDPVTELALDVPTMPIKLIHKPIVTAKLREVLEDLLPVRQFV